MNVFWVNDDFIIRGGEFFCCCTFTSVVFSNGQLRPVARCTTEKRSHCTVTSCSSSNNIQDQCLIITDIYGVREKGGVSEKNPKSYT